MSDAINTEQPDEVVDGYLSRMKTGQAEPAEQQPAPVTSPEPLADFLDDEELAFSRSSWIRKGFLGIILGIGLGVGFYFLFQYLQGQQQLPPTQATTLDKPEATESHKALPSPMVKTDKPVAIQPTQAKPEKKQDRSTKPLASKTKTDQDAPLRRRLKALANGKPHQKKANLRLLKSAWRKYKKRKYQAAAIDFGRAIHMAPEHTTGYYGLALCLFEQGKEQVALKVLDRGAKKVGPKTGLWVLAGSIYQWMGKERMARLAYQRYLKQSPHGKFARDVRVILARDELPALIPYDSDDTKQTMAQHR